MKVWQCSVCKYIHRGDTPPENCPICGVGASKFVEIDEASIPVKETGFEKISPLLVKHHAHPILVHTPNGILPIVAVLWLAAWIFDDDLFSRVAFINLIFVIFAFPLVIFTGILEWKKKFNGTLTLIFKLKILAVALTTVSSVVCFVWYLIDPKILSSPNAWIFLCISILMLISTGIAGHIGGKLVYKD